MWATALYRMHVSDSFRGMFSPFEASRVLANLDQTPCMTPATAAGLVVIAIQAEEIARGVDIVIVQRFGDVIE